MKISLLIPIILGMIGIFQGGLNRQVANQIGLAQATFISMIISFILCFLFFVVVKFYPHYFPSFFQVKAPFTTWRWWFIFPGLFGLLIVAGIPYAIAQLGAVKVTIGLIAAQMIASVIWDITVEKLPINSTKLIGMFFAFLSVAFISFR